MKNNNITTALGYTTGIVLAICCFFYFRYLVPYHLCFKEQIQLFVYSSTYLLTYFSKPAVLACLVGDFLIQFFYFKGIGPVIVTLLLAVEWLLVFHALKQFSVKRYALLWSFLPVIIEWLTIPYAFSVALSVSFIIALSAFILYTKFNRIIVVLAMIPVLYIFAGASVFLFLLLVVSYDILYGRKRYVYWIIMLGLAFSIPLFLRYIYFLTYNQAYFYPYSGFKQALSFVTLVFIVLLFVCFKRLRGQNADIRYLAVTLIILVTVLVTGIVKTTNRNQEYLFGMLVESYHNNWDKVLNIAEKANLQNSIASCYTNMALSKKSLLGERLMDFYQPSISGLLLPNTPGVSWFTIFACNDAYYHVGDIDMAQHAAMLALISSPFQRSVRMVERLVETNMSNGDIAVSMKYIRMLESTLFHKKKPDLFENKSNVMTFEKDVIRKASNKQILLELLTESNPDNIPALDYLLCYYLLTKDIHAFFKVYTSCYKGKFNHVPKVYAQALLIYFDSMKSSAEEIASYNIQPEITKSFNEYINLHRLSNGNYNSMQKKFPNTYWLYYQFAITNN